MDLSNVYLIHDETLELLSLMPFAVNHNLVTLVWEQRQTPPPDARVLVFLNDEKICDLALLAIERQWELGLLPHPDAARCRRALGVEGSVERVFDHYLNSQAIEASILTCNDRLVLSSVVIGEVFSLTPYSANLPPTRGSIIRKAIDALKDLQLKIYTLTTGKEQKIKLAALGMVAIEHTQSTLVARVFSEALSVADGRFTLLVFAPRSLFSYLWFLLRLLFPKQINLARLPNSLGLIRTNQVLIQASRGMDYFLDGDPVSGQSIELRILDQRMRLLPGPKLEPRETQIQTKDQIRLGQLPVDDIAREMAGVPLPLFSRAGEQEHRELFSALRDNAKTSSAYLVLMVLSVLLALTGLYANSAPVIIGAMILAPLMSPVISLAMGLARTESSLIRNSLQSLFAGVGLGLVCAVFVAWIMPMEHLTTEMQARLSPTLLDLSVAVISGVAGAYAHAKEEIAKSLAGVAIAVALVPPLSVVGIGIGWADWSMAGGAFLLLTTNLVGIALAATATFLVLGFAPFKLARKGLLASSLLLAVISVPLYVSFQRLVEQGEILEEIPAGQFEILGEPVTLRILKVSMGNPPLVQVVLSAPSRMDERHVEALRQIIQERTGQSVELDVQLNLRR